MNKRLHAFMDAHVPTPYYRVLRLLRKRYERRQERLSIDEIKRRDEALYRRCVGQPIDWEHPEAYTEKMQLEKLFHLYPEKARLTDKIAVRDWAAERIGTQALVPLYGVYDCAKAIDFAALPSAFVVKSSASSGDAIIVRDKSALTPKDLRRIRARMDFQLHSNYAWYGYEMHYADIRPRILIEQLLDDGTEDLPDYKFLCFDGEPRYCWVDTGRTHRHRRNMYDPDWNLQPWNQKRYGNSDTPLCRPEHFSDMLATARKLSAGFAHVRVDLYNVNGRIYFGEMTFTNGAGFEPIVPYEADRMLGALWNLKL